jgi:hypothetical protein
MNSENQMQDIFQRLTTGEWLVTAGAAWIFIVDYIIGNRITQDHFVSVQTIIAPLSLLVLLAVWVKHGGKESVWNTLYPATLNAAGVLIVVFVALDLLNGLANEFSSSGEFYEITLYIAGAVILGGLVSSAQSSSE